MSEPFVMGRRDYAHLLGDDFTRVIADAHAVAPIVLDGGYASLSPGLEDERRLDSRELDLLTGIAARAKLALTNALSFGSLERTFLSTVEALANALETHTQLGGRILAPIEQLEDARPIVRF